ncbi:MAG TPA: DUF268 domain-containing protein [Acidimicrobiales bacterium]|nr:DUF268 domain-containing protein [Acidimicrobiales bacterium]
MGFPRRAGLSLALAGVDPRALVRAACGTPRFVADFVRFNRLATRAGEHKARMSQLLPALTDAQAPAGAAFSEYFLADLYVARLIYRQRPERHVDVGSRIDGLIAHLLTFVDVDVVDIRPFVSEVPGLRFVHADALAHEGIAAGSAPSVSSLHALEHFGLGRYGDSLDPEGHRKGLHVVARLVAPSGRLYVAVPIGRPTVNFNAHRVLAPTFVADELGSEFDLVEFAAVVDGRLNEALEPAALAQHDWALGIYHLRRR